jgi:hypothetical protein
VSAERTTRLDASVRGQLVLLALATMLAIGVPGCVSNETKRDAVNDINVAFRGEYEAILAKNGTRSFNVSAAEAFSATNAALTRLGLVIEQRSSGLGFISAEAPAPLPLTRAEWDQAAAADLPNARSILSRHVGPLAEFFNFEPAGIDTVITAVVIETRGASEISFTMRMREVAPPKQDLPRRDYPPPSALRIGLNKLWGAIEQELAARPRRQ